MGANLTDISQLTVISGDWWWREITTSRCALSSILIVLICLLAVVTVVYAVYKVSSL